MNKSKDELIEIISGYLDEIEELANLGGLIEPDAAGCFAAIKDVSKECRAKLSDEQSLLDKLFNGLTKVIKSVIAKTKPAGTE